MDGPLGAILGAAAGHLVDQGLRRGDPATGQSGEAAHRLGREDLQVAFAVAVITLAAKLAKADGHVTKAEIAALKRVVRIPDDATRHIARIFNDAKKSPEGFEPYARQIATLLRNNRPMLENLLGTLLMIAHADKTYHPAEQAFIAEVGHIFGFSPVEIRRIENMFVAGAPSTGPDPYEVLGVDASASDNDVKSAYRKLLRENHPDTVVAQGLPEEFVEVANRKMAKINAAYDRIKAERGLS
ncbi:MAG: TerB family tellurite resistance protein [Rhodospirillales bacterium]|nr:TerB family tellurite resistance protein [Rhodospirillales bacterium]